MKLHHEWFPLNYDNEFYESAVTGKVISWAALDESKPAGKQIIGIITGNITNDYLCHDKDLLSYSFWTQRIMYIMTLGVVKKYRKVGIGKLLITRLELYALQRNCSCIYLHVANYNTEAIKFYEKIGFTSIRKIANYYKIENKDVDAILFIKYLNNGRPPSSVLFDIAYDAVRYFIPINEKERKHKEQEIIVDSINTT